MRLTGKRRWGGRATKCATFVLVLSGLLVFGLSAPAAGGDQIIYDTITGGHMAVPQHFGCCNILELGDEIAFQPNAGRRLTTVTVKMYQYAPGLGGMEGYPKEEPFPVYTHPVTLTLYKSTDPEEIIAARTLSLTIEKPFEYFDITFDFSGVVVPDEIVYGLSWATPNTCLPGQECGPELANWLQVVLWVDGPPECELLFDDDLASSGETLSPGFVNIRSYPGGLLAPSSYPGIAWWYCGTAPDSPTTTMTPMLRFDAMPLALKAEQCKNEGWQKLTRAEGALFKNQGDCIQYIKTGK